VGGGASSLVDRLLDQGYRRIIVADISEVALDAARRRLGERAPHATWLVTDARKLRLPEQVDVWHDRAVFHFLTSDEDQEAYLSSLRRALRVGGYVVLATFGLEGPERCSGLPVERYDAAKLAHRLGPDFELLRSIDRRHVTPSGGAQQFVYAAFRRRG
jgi:ubiquinone/menaquinone biosynthesis C-methylase UbiE